MSHLYPYNKITYILDQIQVPHSKKNNAEIDKWGKVYKLFKYVSKQSKFDAWRIKTISN